jgi:hypothetical protein
MASRYDIRAASPDPCKRLVRLALAAPRLSPGEFIYYTTVWRVGRVLVHRAAHWSETSPQDSMRALCSID